jgi:hypothetical protein
LDVTPSSWTVSTGDGTPELAVLARESEVRGDDQLLDIQAFWIWKMKYTSGGTNEKGDVTHSIRWRMGELKIKNWTAARRD